MHQRFQEYYNSIYSYDFFLQYNVKNINEIMKFNDIILHMSLPLNQINDNKKLIPLLMFLELITNQKNKITKSKKNNASLKIKQGTVIGNKINLNKKNIMFFLEYLILFILPNIYKFNGIKLNQKNFNTISFNINNLHDFIEATNPNLLQNVTKMDITIKTNTNSNNHLKNLLSAFTLPIKYY